MLDGIVTEFKSAQRLKVASPIATTLNVRPLYSTLSLQKKAIRLNNQGKTMIAKDSFVPLL